MKINGRRVESTPCAVLTIKPHKLSKDQTQYEFRTYWTEKAGVYGHQIVWQIFRNYELVSQGVTGGCGYCKEQHAFEYFCRAVFPNKKLRTGGSVNDMLYEFRQGGNYYELTPNQFIKAMK